MSVLLDTHLWLWWSTGSSRIGSTESTAFDRLASSHALSVSAISLWEAQMLVLKGRIVPNGPFDSWLRKITAPDLIRLLPLDADVTTALHGLPAGFHGDPADRLIVATARAHGLPLATHDKAIRRSRVVKLWKP